MQNRLIIAMVIGAIAVIIVIAISVHASADDDTKQLKVVHVIFRHGVRTPASTYPNDPHISDPLYPTGWGQITNEGKLELYNAGKFLRERYDTFLGKLYSPDTYYVQTTDVDRTKITAQTINAGLWPPAPEQKWGPLDWLPIPVHSEPLDQDHLLLVRRPCAQYHIEKERLLKSPEIQGILAANQQLFDQLSEATGLKIRNFDDVQDVYSTLMAEERYNLTLPAWTKDLYPHRMEKPTIFSYTLNAYNDQLNRLKGGVLLKKLLKDWRDAADGTLKTKAFLYVGHDATISNILSTLRVWDPQVPNYGVHILMEFSKDTVTREHGLEIFLRNSTAHAPYQLTIPGCDTFCPLRKLEELTRNVIPVDWDAECKSDDPNVTVPPPGGP